MHKKQTETAQNKVNRKINYKKIFLKRDE